MMVDGLHGHGAVANVMVHIISGIGTCPWFIVHCAVFIVHCSLFIVQSLLFIVYVLGCCSLFLVPS